MGESVRGADDGVVPDEPIRFPQANIVAVAAIAEALGTTLGPTARDKLIIQRLATRHEPDAPSMPATDEFYVANDGATILEELPLEHPISPVIRRVIGPERPGDTDVEGKDIPDGVTSTVVLTGTLLEAAEDLIDQGVHPYDIQRGFEGARSVALDALESETVHLDENGDSTVGPSDVARSAMTGNDLGGFKDRWAALAVEAADRIGRPTEETLAVRQIGAGSITDSRLVSGAVLNRNEVCNDDMPTRVDDAAILVLSGYSRGGGLVDPDVREDMKIKPNDPEDLEAIDEAFVGRRDEVVATLVDAGVDVVVARQGISPPFQRRLAEAGIMGIRSVNVLDLKQVALATGAPFVQDPSDVSPESLGRAGIVEEVSREPRRHRRKSRRMIVIDRCEAPRSVCVVLNGVSGQIAEQATTEVRKAVAAVAISRGEGGKRPGVVPGGGAAELAVARAVRSAASAEPSRAQMSMAAFATATERLLAQLVRNAGLDPIESVSNLQAAHNRGESTTGVVLPDGHLGDVLGAGIVDPVAIRHRAFDAATHLATRILRIDDAIDAVRSHKPAGPDEAIYDEPAEQHMDYLDEQEGR